LSTALAQVLPADATRQLYERHSSRIFGFCLSRLGSREEAEDAVQTTFLNVQRGLGRGVVPEYELAWLFKIAQNVCHNRHQSARRRGRVEAARDLDALQDVIASPDRNPAVSLGELTQALGAIPARQRRALVLREFQGYSYEEIANELGISVGAVETLLFRARRGIAQQLEQSGATAGTRRGAAASVVELFRWFFGGAAAPLKLAAVTAAVATTATLSVAAGHKPAPVAPALVKHRAVVPTSQLAPRNVARPTLHHATARVAADQSHGPTLGDRSVPAVQTASNGPGNQPAVSPPALEPALAAGVPTASGPDPAALEVTAPTVTVPEITVPEITVPEITVPAITVPAITVPAVTVPVVTVPPVVVTDVQLPPIPGLPKLP
jgi:RNA polymerase sigma factor (sigma-70 family)